MRRDRARRGRMRRGGAELAVKRNSFNVPWTELAWTLPSSLGSSGPEIGLSRLVFALALVRRLATVIACHLSLPRCQGHAAAGAHSLNRKVALSLESQRPCRNIVCARRLFFVIELPNGVGLVVVFDRSGPPNPTTTTARARSGAGHPSVPRTLPLMRLWVSRHGRGLLFLLLRRPRRWRRRQRLRRGRRQRRRRRGGGGGAEGRGKMRGRRGRQRRRCGRANRTRCSCRVGGRCWMRRRSWLRFQT